MCFLSVRISLVFLELQTTLSIYYFDNDTVGFSRMIVEMALESLE